MRWTILYAALFLGFCHRAGVEETIWEQTLAGDSG